MLDPIQIKDSKAVLLGILLAPSVNESKLKRQSKIVHIETLTCASIIQTLICIEMFPYLTLNTFGNRIACVMQYCSLSTDFGKKNFGSIP